ncbi:hypothetical protein LAZ67_X004903, partial [Cordylochernes scorpioides]
MTAQLYIAGVLQPFVLPFLEQTNNAIFQQDNSRPHTANIPRAFFQNVYILFWPTCFPDIFPIEHVWDMMGGKYSNLQGQHQIPVETPASSQATLTTGLQNVQIPVEIPVRVQNTQTNAILNIHLPSDAAASSVSSTDASYQRFQTVSEKVGNFGKGNCYEANIPRAFFQNVYILFWPTCFPDIFPIEHVWDMMGGKYSNLQGQIPVETPASSQATLTTGLQNVQIPVEIPVRVQNTQTNAILNIHLPSDAAASSVSSTDASYQRFQT